MINGNIFLGLPIDYGDLCKIYPPTVKEVLGLENFGLYRATLTMSQEEIEDAYIDPNEIIPNYNEFIPTPFQYLLVTYHQEDDSMKQIILDSFEFFLKEPVIIVPELELIIIGKTEEELDPDVDLIKPRLITKDNFFEFQNKIRESMGIDAVEPPDPDEDPRVRRVKAKGRQRDKLKAKRQSQNFGNLLTAICCMGTGLNPLNIGEISYASVGYLIDTYQGKEAYDIDIRCLLAGADSKKVKPKYWIK